MSNRKCNAPQSVRSSVKSCVVHQCSLVTYVSENVILNVLNRWKDYIQEWAYILHDRDVYDDEKDGHSIGDPKQRHYHIVLKFWCSVRSQTVVSWFYDPYCGQNTLFKQIESSLGNAYAYLDHRNAPDKVQYPSQSIKCSSREFWEGLDDYSEVDNDSLTQALFEFVEGVPFTQLVRMYGRDFIVNSANIKRCAEMISFENGYAKPIALMRDEINSLHDEIDKLRKERDLLRRCVINESVGK